MTEFQCTELLNLGPDETDYRLLTDRYVTMDRLAGKKVLVVDPDALTLLAEAAMHDVAHLLRASHMRQLRHANMREKSFGNGVGVLVPGISGHAACPKQQSDNDTSGPYGPVDAGEHR